MYQRPLCRRAALAVTAGLFLLLSMPAAAVARTPAVPAGGGLGLAAWEREWRADLVDARVAMPDIPPVEAPDLGTAICEQLDSTRLPNGHCEEWVARYSAPEAHHDAEAEAVTASPDGSRIFVLGSIESTGGFPNLDFLTVAYDAATGEELWTATYAGDGEVYDTPVPLHPLATSPDGSTVYVTGGSFAGDGEAVTIAYDAATGEERWLSVWNGPEGSLDFPYHVLPSPDGEVVYVATDSGHDDADATVIALSASTGEEIWSDTYADPVEWNDFADGLALAPDGSRVFLVSGSWQPIDSQFVDMNIVTVAYGTRGEERGQRLWRSVYDSPGTRPDRPKLVTIAPDGRTLLIGGIILTASMELDEITVAYDAASGSRTWVDRLAGAEPKDLLLSHDGATAYLASLYGRNVLLRALDVPTGALRWSREESFDSQWWNDQPDEPAGLALSPDGSTVHLAASSVGARYNDFWTIAYSAADATRLWSVRFDAELSGDIPSGVVADGARVVVAGTAGIFDPQAGDSNADQIATVAYPLTRGTFLGEGDLLMVEELGALRDEIDRRAMERRRGR